MTRFSRAALTVFEFMDQMGQSEFIANIQASKQYKYLLGHQKTLTFTALMEVVAAHALKMNSFPSFEQKHG